jgi:hypothetical protein
MPITKAHTIQLNQFRKKVARLVSESAKELKAIQRRNQEQVALIKDVAATYRRILL